MLEETKALMKNQIEVSDETSPRHLRLVQSAMTIWTRKRKLASSTWDVRWTNLNEDLETGVTELENDGTGGVGVYVGAGGDDDVACEGSINKSS